MTASFVSKHEYIMCTGLTHSAREVAEVVGRAAVVEGDANDGVLPRAAHPTCFQRVNDIEWQSLRPYHVIHIMWGTAERERTETLRRGA